MPETYAILGCGSAKADEPTRADHLYTSTYFAIKREYAEHFADKTIILSAEHGLVAGWRTVEPYETTIADVHRESFVQQIEWDLGGPFTGHQFCDEVLLLAGSEYRGCYHAAVARDRADDRLWSDTEDVEIVDVFGDADLGGIGDQMAYLREAIDDDLRQPDDGRDQQAGLDRFAERVEVSAE
jgi:hypothetical protein